MMGTGKTVVGQALARQLRRPFFDTDQLVEGREGQTVSDIFASRGEAYFRDVEVAMIKTVVERPPSVIATGGGALLRQENRGAFRQRGILVWLKADVQTMLDRAGKSGKPSRPLLNVENRKAQLERLLVERTPLYAEAPISVETTGRSVDTVAQTIMNRLQGGNVERQEER
jgi:shikimate kinase